MTRLDYATLNSTIRYTMWSVFRVEPGRLPADRAEPAREAQHHLEALEGRVSWCAASTTWLGCAPTPTG